MNDPATSPAHDAAPAAFTRDDPRARKIELIISMLLRLGVISSLAIVAIGTVISFVHHPDYLSQPPALHRLTTPGAAFPHTPAEVVRGLSEFRGQSIVLLGLLLLIATPVFRVAVSILAFAIEKDSRYVVITTIVLVLLILSFLLGKAGG
jgi:uncharacterized membrane protein